MTSSTSACCRFIRCVLPCCFEEPKKKEKSLTRYENSGQSSPIVKHKIRLQSTEMVNIRQILHERLPSTQNQS